MKWLLAVMLCWPMGAGSGVLTGRVDETAVNRVSKCFGVSGSLITAIRLQENGCPGFELGHNGRTIWITREFSKNEWQYAEAARSIAKFSVEFGMKHHRKEYMAYLASRYTAKKSAKTWARNVDILEKNAIRKP